MLCPGMARPPATGHLTPRPPPPPHKGWEESGGSIQGRTKLQPSMKLKGMSPSAAWRWLPAHAPAPLPGSGRGTHPGRRRGGWGLLLPGGTGFCGIGAGGESKGRRKETRFVLFRRVQGQISADVNRHSLSSPSGADTFEYISAQKAVHDVG